MFVFIVLSSRLAGYLGSQVSKARCKKYIYTRTIVALTHGVETCYNVQLFQYCSTCKCQVL